MIRGRLRQTEPACGRPSRRGVRYGLSAGLVVALALAPVMVEAQEPRAEGRHSENLLGTTADLAGFVAWAVANNPLLQSYADRHTASTEVAAQVRGLPDPVLSYGIFTRSPETRVGPQENMVGLSQKVPFP